MATEDLYHLVESARANQEQIEEAVKRLRAFIIEQFAFKDSF